MLKKKVSPIILSLHSSQWVAGTCSSSCNQQQRNQVLKSGSFLSYSARAHLDPWWYNWFCFISSLFFCCVIPCNLVSVFVTSNKSNRQPSVPALSPMNFNLPAGWLAISSISTIRDHGGRSSNNIVDVALLFRVVPISVLDSKSQTSSQVGFTVAGLTNIRQTNSLTCLFWAIAHLDAPSARWCL